MNRLELNTRSNNSTHVGRVSRRFPREEVEEQNCANEREFDDVDNVSEAGPGHVAIEVAGVVVDHLPS